MIELSKKDFEEFGIRSYALDPDDYKLTINSQWKGINNFSIPPQFYSLNNFYDHTGSEEQIKVLEKMNTDEKDLKKGYKKNVENHIEIFDTLFKIQIKII